MTINKSQGQSLKQVGLYLPEPVFTYVALSRVTLKEGLKILIPDEENNLFNQDKIMVHAFAAEKEPHVQSLEKETTPSLLLARNIYGANLKHTILFLFCIFALHALKPFPAQLINLTFASTCDAALIFSAINSEAFQLAKFATWLKYAKCNPQTSFLTFIKICACLLSTKLAYISFYTIFSCFLYIFTSSSFNTHSNAHTLLLVSSIYIILLVAFVSSQVLHHLHMRSVYGQVIMGGL
ncbi:uncharacterized protein LOC126622804 [Malus sylvestris]|uniref:uncharacterized protein LOC126622804 n=1 Tax=Malus sylvestris TaxID=3752 RepID=UPI0021ACF2E8|nr:uncharacterized protein LOC126622804 [Malus sylvestris]